MPPVRNHSSRRRNERLAAYNMAQQILRDPRLRKKLTGKHPRMNVQVTIEEGEGKEVIDLAAPDKNRIEEDILLYEQAFGASRKAGENAKELLKIANREEEWRNNDE